MPDAEMRIAARSELAAAQPLPADCHGAAHSGAYRNRLSRPRDHGALISVADRNAWV
jgi:hypothetical protein